MTTVVFSIGRFGQSQLFHWANKSNFFFAEMGKSSKKANVKVAPSAIPVPSSKPAKKGKRYAEAALEKPVSAKKPKKEIQKVHLKQKDEKKQPETSSSEDTSSESEEELLSKTEVDESSDESDEKPQKKKLKLMGSAVGNAAKPNVKAAKKESSSDEDESSGESFDDLPKAQEKKTKSPESSSSEESFEEDSSEESEDEQPAKAPPKKSFLHLALDLAEFFGLNLPRSIDSDPLVIFRLCFCDPRLLLR